VLGDKTIVPSVVPAAVQTEADDGFGASCSQDGTIDGTLWSIEPATVVVSAPKMRPLTT
jgi:hypothetical protein